MKKKKIKIATYIISLIVMLIMVFKLGSFWIPLFCFFPIWGLIFYPIYYLLTSEKDRLADKKRERKERSRKNAIRNRANAANGIPRRHYGSIDNYNYHKGAEEMDMDNQYYASNHDSSESNPWNP